MSEFNFVSDELLIRVRKIRRIIAACSLLHMSTMNNNFFKRVSQKGKVRAQKAFYGNPVHT